ncbi:hypothetical protein QFC22_000487 [Naganishia vaughanmartiniae]|uniref:Uncharacterized protein n=1 Tax=Naganishia vaughanmartiniae TaxID=1424756 RepID=A0ACC2XPG2_9TREE|nr:hypothetical protein QFC22_000487 [Naganishia vaughanmartiniae]
MYEPEPTSGTYGESLLIRTTDLTTLYATATFWTYGFSLLLLKTRLSSLTLTAIIVAFLGVGVITYSGAHASSNPSTEAKEPPHRVLGDLIMLAGAICLGFYEVVYKLSLPEGHGGVVSPLSDDAQDPPTTTTNHYEAISTPTDDEPFDEQPKHTTTTRPNLVLNNSQRVSSLPLVQSDLFTQELQLPLAIHANFLTSLIGVATLLLFWIPIPLLHWTGLEEFGLPKSGDMGLLAVICTMGATYNAGFMCLIGLLGPVTASVANLLAIGLVALIDAVYLGRAIPFWTLCGALLVAAGFGVLLYQGEGEGRHDTGVEGLHHAKDGDDADEL